MIKSSRKIALALILFGASAFAPAMAAENIKGIGATSCSAMMGYMNDPDEDVRTQISIATWSWMQGHFSGKNLALPETQQRDLTYVTPASLMSVVLRVCPTNPDALIYQIAESLYEDLPYFSATGV